MQQVKDPALSLLWPRFGPQVLGSLAWEFLHAVGPGQKEKKTKQNKNDRPLTHRVRPGIKPASSWILVGLWTTEPQWELQTNKMILFIYVFYVFLSFVFLGPHPWHMEVPRLGSNWSATYSTAHGNAGSLTYWARPGIETASSWILVRFVSICAEPQHELLFFFFFPNKKTLKTS